jgi:hypothetical protein
VSQNPRNTPATPIKAARSAGAMLVAMGPEDKYSR